MAKTVEPISGYEIVDTSAEGYFYHSMEKRAKKSWVIWGASAELNFDTSKMPSKFSIFVYRDKEFINYTQTSKSIKIKEFEGFWFVSE